MNTANELNLLTFRSAIRTTTSVNGNPAWFITFEGVAGPFRTSSDAMFSYEVSGYKRGDLLAVKFTRADRIAYAYRVRMVNGRAERIR